jgi:hypothetical protein
MDLKLHRPQTACATTGRPFAPGELFYSVLVRSGGTLARIDTATEAWLGPPAGAIAWWRSRYPQAGATGPTLAPPDVLLDALESLEDEADDGLRYLLALQLVRRRVLRIVDDAAEPQPRAGTVTFACRKRDREYRLRPLAATEAGVDGLESRLAALLWSGDAA